jgi:tetratricopeptide (TPR) repeat protein
MAVSLISCENKEISIRLQEAERLMEQRPDSSLKVLEKLESEKAPSKRQYALWCLLVTQAKDKNYVIQTSDSLIRAAVDYFEKKGDKPRLTQAYYYSAVIYHDTGDFLQAQEFYLKALEAGESSADPAMLGRICANLGSMYNYQSLTKDAKMYQEKAVEHFLAVNDSVNTGMAWRNIGRIYARNDALDSAIVCYSKAILFLSKQNRSSIYSETGGIYKRMGDYPKALEFIRLALESLTEKNDTAPLYLNLGDLYRQTGQYDSARYYLSFSLASPDMYTKAGAILSLSYLEEERQNYPVSLTLRERYLQLQDSINKAERSRDLKKIESLYNYNQVEKERNFYEREAGKKTNRMYLSVILAFTFLVIVFALYLYNARLKKENQEKTLRLEEMKLQVEKQSKKAGEDKKANEIKAENLRQKIIHDKIKVDNADWKALIETIDGLYPDFIHHLKILFPKIKEDDLRVCCLKKIDVPVNRIADILSKSSQGISNQRSRLYEKLTGHKGTATDLDKFLHDL